MKILQLSPRAMWLGFTLTLLGSALQSQAQTSDRSVRPAAQPQAPGPVGALAPGGLAPPNPRTAAGLPSPIADRAGLASRFPAGLPSPRDSRPGSPPTSDAVPELPVRYRGGYVAEVAGDPYRAGSFPFTALDIARSFLRADSNRDGELTPTEAQRLTIMPYSFEDMDGNRDRIVSRSEYEDSLRGGPRGR